MNLNVNGNKNIVICTGCVCYFNGFLFSPLVCISCQIKAKKHQVFVTETYENNMIELKLLLDSFAMSGQRTAG